MFGLLDFLRMTPPFPDQEGGEFSFQRAVTLLAVIISFSLSAVLIIITRTLSLAG